MNSIDFLLGVWELQCQSGDYVALSSKGATWSDYTFPYDDQLRSKLSSWLDKHQGQDLYFCPLPFTHPKRSKQCVARSRLLWSDIDHADPHRVPASILWESSPGRHQGLWVLPKTVTPQEAAEGSKKLAYYIGADRGGWDLTQVLRIPGTHNFKYEDAPEVKLVHFNSKKVLRKIPENALEKWRNTIPKRIARIIEGPAEVGKRSDMLWYLEHELLDLGIPLNDVIEILRDSEWNKYRGRADEDERFTEEMKKIRGDRDVKQKETRTEAVILYVEDYSEVMGSNVSQPGWMVRDWWLRSSHGIIAAEPKSFKSTIAMDMLFSVASDTPFLGSPVEQAGPVIIIQNENAAWIMKDRLEKMAVSRGEVGRVSGHSPMTIEWARNLPMFFINQQGFTLDDAANMTALEELIQRERPVAIKLDPLYLMFSGDVNSAQELFPVLKWCLYIKNTYNCAVILVHHNNKGTENKRGGQKMLGSVTLHGWVESAWYLQPQESEDETGIITLDREFRGAGMYPKIDLEVSMGPPGDTHYQLSVREHKTTLDDISEEILTIIVQSKEPMNKTSIAKKSGHSRDKISRILDQMVIDGKLVKVGERFATGREL